MKKSILLLFSAALMMSCSDFLTREPEAKFSSEDYFKNENSLKNYLNGFVQKYTPAALDICTGDAYSDICVTTNSTPFLTEYWDLDKQTGWSNSNWNMLYNVNWFLAHFRETPGVSEEVLKHYEATARFWRAYFYYGKVKTFGNVPWYDKPITSSDEEALYKSRDDRDLVMKNVLEDLNFACENLSASADWTSGAQINKYIALAFKSRVCLFEGTFRKYHSVNPSTQEAWADPALQQTFIDECIDACEKLMATGAFTVYNGGNVKTQYRDLFTKEAVNRNEVIWAREYSSSLNIGHEVTWRFAAGGYGGSYSGSHDFVRMFLNLDGSFHTDGPEELAQEMTGRDWRLTQIFMGPEYTKTRGGVPNVKTAPNFAVTRTGYHVCKFTLDDTAYEASATATNAMPIIRYPEVLLNYAEAKWEKGEFDSSVWNVTVRPIRERAGVVGDMPATADPFLAEYYGMSDIAALEIRRERAIELFLEDLRTDDLDRWHKGNLLTRDWYGIYIPAADTPFDLNNDGTNDICFYTDKAGNEAGVVYLKLDGTRERTDDGRLKYNVTRQWDEKKYIRPIPRSALVVNPNLGQNKLWMEE
ncbi:MAG: RagB/SusD family nutrient uptake outer membrane protein [Candidatus Cryptobacteroides sp.]